MCARPVLPEQHWRERQKCEYSQASFHAIYPPVDDQAPARLLMHARNRHDVISVTVGTQGRILGCVTNFLA